jgi:hypothetical protein
MKVGDIVTVMALSGEYVGRVTDISDIGAVTIEDPRMIIANDQGMGFANGIAATGVKDPKEVTFQSYVFATETNEEVISAWRQQVSGLITKPAGGIIGV